MKAKIISGEFKGTEFEISIDWALTRADETLKNIKKNTEVQLKHGDILADKHDPYRKARIIIIENEQHELEGYYSSPIKVRASIDKLIPRCDYIKIGNVFNSYF